MKLSTRDGITLLKQVQTDHTKLQSALLSLKGVDNIEQLSVGEIRELGEIGRHFTAASLNPKDIDDITIELTITVGGKNYGVVLDNLGELDITYNALSILADFNPEVEDEIALMIGAVYSGVVKERLGFAESHEKIAHLLAEAVKDQMDYEDAYALHHFFAIWKGVSTTNSHLSYSNAIKYYRRVRRMQRPTRMLIGLLLRSSGSRSGRLTVAISALSFGAKRLGAAIVRWYRLLIGGSRRRSTEKRKRSPKNR